MKKLPQKRDAQSVFPMPEPGEVVELNPPSLQWVGEPGAESYRVVVRRLPDRTVVADKAVKHNYFRFDGMLAPGLYSWDVISGDASRGEWEFEVPAAARPFVVPSAAEVLAKVPKAHPRHLHYPADLPELRTRHAAELEVLKRNVKIALAEPVMAYPDYQRPDSRFDYRRAFDESRRLIDRNMTACSLAYLLLNDREAGLKARDFVLRICEWNPAGPCSVRGPWGDEIGLSLCRTLPATVDWTWDLYNEKEKSWIVATLAQHARQIYEHMIETDFLGHPGNSHSGRLPGYLGELALVLAGHIPDETVMKYLDYALEVYGSIFPHYGGRAGGWAEGPFYASSYTKWYLPFFFAIERHTGFSFLDKPFFRRVSQFFVHFAPPGQESHPFGDGNWPTEIEWPGFQAQNPFGVYAERFGPELAREFSRRLTAEIDIYKLHLLDIFRPKARRDDRAAAGPAMNSFICRDTGLISMRRNVAEVENAVAVLARASRYGSPSHQHADQGNFAVLAGGKALLAPTGSFGDVFGEDHHRCWTTQTVAQNCFMVDGKGQQKHSAEAVGKILEFRDEGKRCIARFDLGAAYPMLKKAIRELVFDREKLTLDVTDELEADRPVTIDWRLHSYARPEVNGAAVRLERAPGRAEITLRTDGAAVPVPTWTDRFVYPDDSATEIPPKRDLLDQYHLNWRFAPAAKLTVKAHIQIGCD